MGFIFRGNSRVNKGAPIATSLRVQSSVQGQPIPIIHGQQRVAGNLIWYGNFTYTSGSGGGKGGKGGVAGGGGKAGTGSGSKYSASFALGIAEGPIDSILTVWNNKTPEAPTDFSLFNGYQGQTPWSYLTTSFPSEAITYSSLAYAGTVNMSLGQSPDLPNFNFEIKGAISGAVTETYTIGSPYTFTPTYWNLSASTIEVITIPASPYQYQAQNYTAATALPVILGNVTNPVGTASAGVIDSSGILYTKVTGTPSTGQYSVTATGLYTFAAADAGKEITVIDLAVSPGVNYIYQPTGTITSGSATITSVTTTGLATGQLITAAGIPAGTVITGVSGSTVTISQNATASGTVTLTCWGAPLTQVLGTPAAGHYSVTAAGQYQFSASDNGKLVGIVDIPDADPTLSLTDYLTNPRYGLGFPSVNLGDLSTLKEYAFANGLFVSPVISQQQAAQNYLKDFSTGINGEFVWSSGLLTWKPYGDTSATGYGQTYTAPSSPIYSLGDDDYLKNASTIGSSPFTSDDPVACSRLRPSDAYNDVKLEYLDRGNSYNPAIVEAKDDAAINAYGLRPQDTRSLHFFCSAQPALTSAQLQLGRQQVRNQYSFTVPWYYILLDPMDIIAISDSNVGLDNQWVRILEITENSQDSSLTIIAEEVLSGTGSAPQYGTQVKAGFAPNYNIDPGPAIAPIVFEPPVSIATNSGLECWLVTGGGSNWGGANVYVSRDNQTYRLLGRYEGSSRIGVNNADFPASADPDTTNTLDVVLSTAGELYSATSQEDVDLGHTLCYEGGYPNPAAPTLSSISGGTLAAATYYTRITYVFSGGEGPPSPEDSLSVDADNLLSVASPPSQTGVTGYNVYVGTSTGTETRQNTSAIPIGTDWTLPTTGLISGASPPPSETSYELVGYESATLVSGSEYDLGTYIRRGMYGTTITDHPAGSQFARLDGSQFVFPYDKGQIGSTIYIKLLSFNNYSGGQYTLDEVQPFQHVIEGPPLPGIIQTFSVAQNGGSVVFGWSTLSDPALISYDILYGPQGDTVDTAQLLTEATKGTEMTNASVPPGTWTFYIRGRDIAGQLGPVTSQDFIVTNINLDISDVPQEPDWLGTIAPASYFLLNSGARLQLNSGGDLLLNASGSNTFVRHYTGVLIPVDQNLASFYGWETFDDFVPTPISSAFYIAPTVDTAYNDTLRVYATSASTLGPGQTGDAAQLQFSIDTWLTGGTASGNYTPWTIGYIELRYLSAQLTYGPITAGNVSFIREFTPVIDAQPVTQNAGNVSVAAGGTAITFDTPFHTTPFITCTAQGSSSLIATYDNATTTGFTAHVFNSSGTDVGGTISWSAEGD